MDKGLASVHVNTERYKLALDQNVHPQLPAVFSLVIATSVLELYGEALKQQHCNAT